MNTYIDRQEIELYVDVLNLEILSIKVSFDHTKQFLKNLNPI